MQKIRQFERNISECFIFDFENIIITRDRCLNKANRFFLFLTKADGNFMRESNTKKKIKYF